MDGISQTINFIISFFLSKRVSLITAFLCWDQETIQYFLHSSSSGGLRVINVGTFSTGVHKIPAVNDHTEGIVLDVSCSQANNVLEMASRKRLFNILHLWLIVDSQKKIQTNESKIEQFMVNKILLPDSMVMWHFNITQLIEVYKTKADGPLITNKIKIETERNISMIDKMVQVWNQLPPLAQRRRNLQNIYIRAATIISQPEHFTYWNDLTTRHIDTWPKCTYPLILNMASDLNFRLDVLQTDNYGVETNGSFDGLVGRIQRSEIEFGVTSMFMRKDRWNVCDFLAETFVLRSFFMFRQPPQSTVSNIFILPFSPKVWIVALVAFTAIGVMVCVQITLLREVDTNLRNTSPSDVFSVIIGAICQQGSILAPSSLSSRIIVLFAFITSILLFTSYSAKIVALLQTPSTAIQTINDLAHSRMILGVQETTYKKVYFMESSDLATQYLYKHKIAPQGPKAFMSVVNGILKMKKERFAFQVEASSGYQIISDTYTEREKCGLAELEAFRLPMVAVPIRKGSGYRELFAVRLRWQRENGLMDQIRRTWLAKKPICNDGLTGFASVGISECLPAIKMLLYSVILSMGILLLECVSKCHFNRNGYN